MPTPGAFWRPPFPHIEGGMPKDAQRAASANYSPVWTATGPDDETTRTIPGDGRTWTVRELPYPVICQRPGTSLIFSTDAVVRRVRHFPPNWFTHTDTELYALSLCRW
jgi:hypothetical protein